MNLSIHELVCSSKFLRLNLVGILLISNSYSLGKFLIWYPSFYLFKSFNYLNNKRYSVNSIQRQMIRMIFQIRFSYWPVFYIGLLKARTTSIHDAPVINKRIPGSLQHFNHLFHFSVLILLYHLQFSLKLLNFLHGGCV